MPKPKFRAYFYLPDYPSKIEDLTHLARAERWDYQHDEQQYQHQILVNYISHTFMRLYELNEAHPGENYLVDTGALYCFNTGLFTKNFEPIYALATPNEPQRRQRWILKGFYKESAHELRAIPELPRRASYFDNVQDLIYDTRLDLRVNMDHILEDDRNRKRIPEKYRDLPNLSMMFRGGALEYAKVRIKENYKAAVPQYYSGKLQFLIPISLGDPSVVDLSLAVGREGDIYTGHTCLTLDMAYNNARLIAKPESDWLVNP